MKTLLSVSLLFFIFSGCNLIFAQVPGQWVWIHGDSAAFNSGSYGLQGVPGPSNDPPSSYESCNWTDHNGNFWLYGGWSPTGTYADMWKYDPATNEWTWMKGPGTPNYFGSYGIQGVSSPTNNPPNMSEGATTWTDGQGDLWLFGSRKNDLWRYVISTNEWTWIKGPNMSGNAGVYGTKGVPNILNNPPSRYECASSWTDNNGNLWMFGGMLGGAYNDLWKYDPGTNEWTWISGSSSLNQLGVYGTLGVEDPANIPGARATYTHWMDNTGNFYIFGGEKITPPYIQFNDFWRYNPATNMWAWMGGTNAANSDGFYNSKCIHDSLCIPSSRFENRVVWTDAQGNFWHFGGAIGTSANLLKNDLWMYCLAEKKWIWQSGDSTYNPSGYWGTKGVSDPLNKPNGRAGAVSWSGPNNNLYLFGGSSSFFSQFRNDLWMYTIDSACANCLSAVNANFSVENICPGTCTDFTNLSTGASSYIWSFTGGNPSVSTDAFPSGICYASPGNYDVMLIASNATSSDTLISNITVYPFPPLQGILQDGDTLFANPGATSYQWFFNSNIIPGATTYFYIAAQSGNYNVVATDENGCEVEAVINNVIAGAMPLASGSWPLAIFPNPVSDNLEIRNLKCDSWTIKIFNMIGSAVTLPAANCQLPTCTLDVSSLDAGTYYVELVSGKNTYRSRFIKQ